MTKQIALMALYSGFLYGMELPHVREAVREEPADIFNPQTAIPNATLLHSVLNKAAARNINLDQEKELPIVFEFREGNTPVNQLPGDIPREVTNIIDILQNFEYYQRLGVQECPCGMILHGPTGTGKSTLAEAIATETGSLFVRVYSSDFVNKWAGNAVKVMRALFEQANARAIALAQAQLNAGPNAQRRRVILFIDEVDGIANTQMRGSDGETLRAVHEIHKQLKIMHRNVFVILACNNFKDIPDTLKDRFRNHTVFIGLPDWAQRFALLNHHFRQEQFNIPAARYNGLADATEGLSRRAITDMIQNAVIIAARRRAEQVNLEDFSAALQQVQDTRTTNADDRRVLINRYLVGKRPTQVQQLFLQALAQEIETWNAGKIEAFVNLADGLARAKNRAHIEEAHFSVALALNETERRPLLARKRALLSHLLEGIVVQGEADMPNFLLSETENATTEQIQRIIAVAQDIARNLNIALSRDHFLAAVSIINANPQLDLLKRKALLAYLLHAKINPLTADALNELAGLPDPCSYEDYRAIAEKAQEINNNLQTFEVRHFVIAHYILKKSKLTNAAHQGWCVTHINSKQRLRSEITQAALTVLANYTNEFTVENIENIFRNAEAYASRYASNSLNDDHLNLASYISCPHTRLDTEVRRKVFAYLFQVGVPQVANAAAMSAKLANRTDGFELAQIERVVQEGQQCGSKRQPQLVYDIDLFRGLFRELRSIERPVQVQILTDKWRDDDTRMSRMIDDRMPNGIIYWPTTEEIDSIIRNNLMLRTNTITPDLVTEFSEDYYKKISAYGITRLLEEAYAIATRRAGDTTMTDTDFKEAAWDLYCFKPKTSAEKQAIARHNSSVAFWGTIIKVCELLVYGPNLKKNGY